MLKSFLAIHDSGSYSVCDAWAIGFADRRAVEVEDLFGIVLPVYKYHARLMMLSLFRRHIGVRDHDNLVAWGAQARRGSIQAHRPAPLLGGNRIGFRAERRC